MGNPKLPCTESSQERERNKSTQQTFSFVSLFQMKGTSSLSISQEQSECVPSSSRILKHQSFLIPRSVAVTLWAFSDVPLLLVVASSDALSRSLLFCATATRVKQSCSFLFLSLGSLRWAEVCLGWVSCSLRKWCTLVRELRWVWQRKAWCYIALCVAGPMNGANGEQAPVWWWGLGWELHLSHAAIPDPLSQPYSL